MLEPYWMIWNLEDEKGRKHLEEALKTLDATGLTYGRDIILRAIGSIKNA